MKLHETPKVGIKNFACVVPFIERNLAALENDDFCRDGFYLGLSCNLFLWFLLIYFLVANDDGLYDMEDKCLEAIGDKTPFGVVAGECGNGGYALKIDWLMHQKTIYDLLIYVITMKLQNLFYFYLYLL